jgi:amino acid adenylation domain-containing protein
LANVEVFMQNLQPTDKRQILLDRMLKEDGARLQAPGTIPRRRSSQLVPLSFGQERMWFLDQLAPGNPFYAETGGTVVRMPVDPDALQRAIDAIVERHEILRTRFEMRQDQPVQVVEPSLHIPIAFIDLSDLPAAKRAAEVERLTAEQGLEAFELERGPLLRFTLVRLGPREHVFIQSIHHILTDGWSLRVFHSELSELYVAFATGREPNLPALPIQYGDFAVWQRSEERQAEIDLQVAYWRKQLAGLTDLALPYDHPRPRVLSYRGAHITERMPPSLSAELHAFSRRERTTPYITALAAFAVLLGLYTGREDIVVGTPVAGRNRLELEPLIGLFLNTLVLRVDLRGDPSFQTLLQRVREVAVDAYSNPDVPFDRLVEELRPQRDLGRNPLFQVLFQYVKPHREQGPARAASDQESVPFERGTAILDLSFHLWDSSSGTEALIEYSTELFEAATIGRLFKHFVAVLAAVVAHPDRPLSNISIHDTESRDRMLRESQGTELAPPPAGTIHALLRRQVQATPDAVALIEPGRKTSFADLDRAAEAIATRLATLQVGRGGRVAICLARSVEMVMAMLGVLKAGAAFVPLDPSYPTERLRYVLEDSRATVLIITPEQAQRLAPVKALVLPIASAMEGAGVEVRQEPELHPLDGAYIMYTSGSTGRPKGVMATHQSTLNRFAWMWKTFPFAPGEVASQKTAVGFVDAIWEIFGPLLAGVPLVIVPEAAVRDSSALVTILAEHKVTRLLMVPSLLQMLLERETELARELPALRWWFSSGERLPGELARQARINLPDACLVNLYGSSEVAGDVTYAVLTDDEPPGDVPIGWPIANCRAYVLDRHFRLVPQGVAGDLYVAGPNLAQGYWERPGITAERFLPDPFGAAGSRMYFTGDRAHQQPDGCLEFLGRLDQQVKLRGFRIELGEIEAVLEEDPAVRQAAAVVVDDDAGGRLAAYVIPGGSAEPRAEELRQRAAARLPPYMVPASVILVEALPLLPNGKLDRTSLGAVKVIADQAHAVTAPRTEAEAALAPLWEELLNLPRVGVTDNFFNLGGHSLLATRLVSRIRDLMGIELPLPDVFLHPTIAEQAQIIEAKLLGEIESMSDEQARRHSLAAEGSAP